MIRQSIALTAVVSIAALSGCQAGAQFDPQFGRTAAADRTQLAAYAASTEFPRDAEASDDLRAAALIDRRANTVRVLNFSDRPLRDASIWVNGSFVNRVDTIPANGSITIPSADFYDATGRSLSAQATTANVVQLQVGDDLYNLQGPVYDQ